MNRKIDDVISAGGFKAVKLSTSYMFGWPCGSARQPIILRVGDTKAIPARFAHMGLRQGMVVQRGQAGRSCELEIRPQFPCRVLPGDGAGREVNGLGPDRPCLTPENRKKLQRNRPKPSQAELRCWEWRYLRKRCQSEVLFFTPDGRAVATGSDDGLAKLWEPFAKRELAALRGHLLAVHSVAVSPDGQRLATGGNATEAIKLWDLVTGQEVATLEGKGTIFFKTIFSPDGNTLVSLNVQGMAHVGHAPSLAEIEAMERAEAESGQIRTGR